MIFNFRETWRLFVFFKNGPYAIFNAEDPFNEIYRSGASYKDSAILKNDSYNFFVVKTTAGIFSIDFCKESQDTWFLTEDDPEYILSNKSKSLLIALYLKRVFECLFIYLLGAIMAKFLVSKIQPI